MRRLRSEGHIARFDADGRGVADTAEARHGDVGISEDALSQLASRQLSPELSRLLDGQAEQFDQFAGGKLRDGDDFSCAPGGPLRLVR